MSETVSLMVATRLHLGHASTPPNDLSQKISSFQEFCSSIQATGIMAVDATPKIPGYDLCTEILAECQKQSSTLQVIPVQPWGQFVPALNALVSHAAKHRADYILFVSAETSAPKHAIDQLLSHIVGKPDTLVAGAMLPGHEYTPGLVDLHGRSSPWNTLAVWDVRKLSLTGFQLVSDGLLTKPGENNFAGIEEVVTTALLQKLFPDSSKSKLVKLDGVSWDVHFDDEERRNWHEAKMHSKLKRSLIQLELMGLSGQVEHC